MTIVGLWENPRPEHGNRSTGCGRGHRNTGSASYRSESRRSRRRHDGNPGRRSCRPEPPASHGHRFGSAVPRLCRSGMCAGGIRDERELADLRVLVAPRGRSRAVARVSPGMPGGSADPEPVFCGRSNASVAGESDTPLARLYDRAPEHGPPPELPHAFEEFCAVHAERIVNLARARNVQTNEVGRCSHLMPAFGVIAQATGQDLALIDIGPEPGLNCCGTGSTIATPTDRRRCGTFTGAHRVARAEAKCRVFRPASRRPPLPLGSISTRSHLGDRRAVSMARSADLARACGPKRRCSRTHVRSGCNTPPRVEAGDALALLPVLVAEAPADSALCVFHCHALNQFPVEARESFTRLLRSAAQSRPCVPCVVRGGAHGRGAHGRGPIDHAVVGVAQRARSLGAVVARRLQVADGDS